MSVGGTTMFAPRAFATATVASVSATGAVRLFAPAAWADLYELSTSVTDRYDSHCGDAPGVAGDAVVAVVDHGIGVTAAHRHHLGVPAEELPVESTGLRGVVGDVFEPNEFSGLASHDCSGAGKRRLAAWPLARGLRRDGTAGVARVASARGWPENPALRR